MTPACENIFSGLSWYILNFLAFCEHSCVRGNFSWLLWTDGSPALPVIMWRAFLGVGTPDEQDAGCLWPSEASHCNVWVLHDRYRGTQVSASQSKWGAKGHTKLASVQVNGHVPPKTASLPLDFFVFLSSRKADRHRSISKGKKHSWRVLVLLLAESYQKNPYH